MDKNNQASSNMPNMSATEQYNKLNMFIDNVVEQIKNKNGVDSENWTPIPKNVKKHQGKDRWFVCFKLMIPSLGVEQISMARDISGNSEQKAKEKFLAKFNKIVEHKFKGLLDITAEFIYAIPIEKYDPKLTNSLRMEYQAKYDGIMLLVDSLLDMASTYKTSLSNNEALLPHDRYIFDNLPENISTVLQLGLMMYRKLEEQNIGVKFGSNTFSVAL